MRLFVLAEPGRLAAVEVDDPLPAPGEVRVRVACVGICGSDLEVFHGRRTLKSMHGHPVVGHETSGVIDRVGAGVTGLRAGDRVAINGSWGSLADYVVAKPENVLRFPPRIELRDGCLLEVLPGVMMAATRTGIDRSTDVLIAGQGLSGLLLTRAVALHGCRRLIVVDPVASKLALALELGATAVHRGRLGELQAELLAQYPGGFDTCIVAAPGAGCIDESAPLVRSRGRIVFYGGLEQAAAVDLLRLHQRSISLIKEGECINGVLDARELWRLGLGLALDGALPLRRLRTHVVRMDDAQRAFELRSDPSGEAIHVVLENRWASEAAAAANET